MPTHTPSPHRFLAPNAHSAQQSTRPHSSLRHAAANPPPTATPGLQAKKLTPAKRFFIAPPQKNIVSDTGKPGESDAQTHDDAQSPHTPFPRPRRKLERVESIEEASQPSQQDAKDDVCASGVISSIEIQDTLSSAPKQRDVDEGDDEMLFESTTRAKRQRMSPSGSPSLQQPPEGSSTPLPVSNSTTHRFKVAPPRTSAPFPSIAFVTAAAKSSTSSPRPHFILPEPPTSPPKTSRPPPEIFSPSRKHGKYIPGGLATTASTWVIETASTGFAAQEKSAGAWRREKDDGVKVRLKISCLTRGGANEHETQQLECCAGSVVFASGETETGLYSTSRASGIPNQSGEMKIVLAGQGGVRGPGGVQVKIGSVIGVRAPTWEIDVGKEKWLMAVDWVVL
jgi:hypothetical protein